MPATDKAVGKRVQNTRVRCRLPGSVVVLVAHLAQWAAPAPVTTPVAEVDLRIGGANLIVMRVFTDAYSGLPQGASPTA